MKKHVLKVFLYTTICWKTIGVFFIFHYNNMLKKLYFPLQQTLWMFVAFPGSLGRVDLGYSSRELGVRSPKTPSAPVGSLLSKARLKATVVSLKHAG